MYETYHASGISNRTKGIILIILGFLLLFTALLLHLSQSSKWHEIKRSDQSGLRYSLKVPSGWQIKNSSPGLKLEIYSKCSGNNTSTISFNFSFTSDSDNLVKSLSADLLKSNYTEEKKILNTYTLYSYTAPGSKESLSYLPIPKGYFLITSNNGCRNLESISPQILATLKITE